MNKDYNNNTHFYGRIWMVIALILILSVPLVVCIAFNAWPPIDKVLLGLLGVAPIYWTVNTIEVLTFAPMLGPSGTYLGFVTGNLTSLKVPCSINAMNICNVSADTEEGDVISTIAIATSTIVNTVILTLGMLLLIPLTPILESPTLAPMFDNVLPALFGALGIAFLAKDFKIAVVPLTFMLLLFILVPSLSSAVSIFVPVSAAIAIIWARWLFKKGFIGKTKSNDETIKNETKNSN